MIPIVSQLFDVDAKIDVLLTKPELEEFLAALKNVGISRKAKANERLVNFLLSLASTAKAGTMLPGKIHELNDTLEELKNANSRVGQYSQRWELVCDAFEKYKAESEQTIKQLREACEARDVYSDKLNGDLMRERNRDKKQGRCRKNKAKSIRKTTVQSVDTYLL